MATFWCNFADLKDSLMKIARRLRKCDYFDYFAAPVMERGSACGYIKNSDGGYSDYGQPT